MAKSKSGRKKKTSTVIHGVVTSEMTKEEIEEYVVLLRAELERERAERNKTALERDKVTTFWETCRQQVEDARSLLRKKERELEDAEERHQMEMRVYRQKVKHLLFEENARQVDARHDITVTLNAKAEETRVEVRELLNESYTLKAQMRLRQLESEDAIKMLKKQHETEMTTLRQNFILQAEELEQRAAKQAAQLREDLETQRVSEIHATEERKNLHIKQLEAAHDKAFNNMKSYYNDITLGNVNVIKTLKESIEELRSSLVRMQRDLESSRSETARYKQKLEESEEQNNNLRKVAHLFETEKSAHNVTKANLRLANKTKANNEMLYNIAQARLDELEAEKKRLTDRMEMTLLEIKRKAGLRCALLEKKLTHLVAILEAKETEVHTLIMASNADAEAVKESRKNLEELLNEKNTAIRELQYEVSRVAKAYTDLWQTCQEKLMEEMSHPENMGIKPLGVNVSLVSPFNPATAQAKLLNLTSGAQGTASGVILGKGPLGLTSIPPP
ncbi:Dynein regulatory complex subunit 4 [Taenia crassiceps]|uniref:Dynein regulatory complex subunit 4 n=1 Tax=Taenia crassiceps TaxID=6207 RepID=A0ABR4PZA9_9CEST